MENSSARPTAAEVQPNRRSVLLIDPNFQKSYLMFTVGSAIGVSAFYYIAIEVFFSNFKQRGLALGLSTDHVFFRFLDEQKFSLDIIFLIATVTMTVGLLAYGLYVSNRIVGPIHQIKNSLREFRTGRKISAIAVREKDYFKELAEEINLSLVEAGDRKMSGGR